MQFYDEKSRADVKGGQSRDGRPDPPDLSVGQRDSSGHQELGLQEPGDRLTRAGEPQLNRVREERGGDGCRPVRGAEHGAGARVGPLGRITRESGPHERTRRVRRRGRSYQQPLTFVPLRVEDDRAEESCGIQHEERRGRRRVRGSPGPDVSLDARDDVRDLEEQPVRPQHHL